MSNLVDNAIRHNTPGGSAQIEVRGGGGDVELTAINTGPVVPAAQIDRLLQPFQRLAGDRVGYGEGLGLGLSIVAAIANAHGAALDVRPGAHGGLEISVRFPRARPSDVPAPSPRDAQAVGLGLAES